MDVVVATIERLQKTHPPLAGLPLAAQIGDLPLFIGEAGAATNGEFLRERGIGAVVSLGTGDIAAKVRLPNNNVSLLLASQTLTCHPTRLYQPARVHCVAVLDMEDELLLPFFAECIAFIDANVTRSSSATTNSEHKQRSTNVLVHCVYGQSRSAAICVAYLMAIHRMSLQDAYDAVAKARPCIYINLGFLRQLALFDRMGAVADIMGDTPAHAELRTMMTAKERRQSGAAEIRGIPQLTLPRRSLHCRKCSQLLATTRNELAHGGLASNLRVCGTVFIEPMQWMADASSTSGYGGFVGAKEGKLACPSCSAKIGSWNWIGVKEAVSCSMGGATSNTLYSEEASSTATERSSLACPKALVFVLGTVTKDKVPTLLRATRYSFTLDKKQFKQLFTETDEVGALTLEIVFSVFDPSGRDKLDSCEVAASLVLVSPHLQRGEKLRAVFQIFNVSKCRVGQLTSDEATMLFRTIATGAFKMLRSAPADSARLTGSQPLPSLPTQQFYENLTKALFAEQEVLSEDEFVQLCGSHAAISGLVQVLEQQYQQTTGSSTTNPSLANEGDPEAHGERGADRIGV